MKRDNLTVVLVKFARELGIPLGLQKAYDELLIHPDYPSLLAISDVLKNFGIDNIAFRTDKNELQNVPCPFIAHTIANHGDFLLIHKIEKEKVVITD